MNSTCSTRTTGDVCACPVRCARCGRSLAPDASADAFLPAECSCHTVAPRSRTPRNAPSRHATHLRAAPAARAAAAAAAGCVILVIVTGRSAAPPPTAATPPAAAATNSSSTPISSAQPTGRAQPAAKASATQPHAAHGQAWQVQVTARAAAAQPQRTIHQRARQVCGREWRKCVRLKSRRKQVG